MSFRLRSLIYAVLGALSLIATDAQATLETAEVLPPGVPNFMLEFQYDVTSRPTDPSQIHNKFGATYHFGIGFKLGPIRSDFDAYRRFGPKFATETGFIFETMALSEDGFEKVPSISINYGYTGKSSDIFQSIQGGGTAHAFRHGLVVSKMFPTKWVQFSPFMGIQGDWIFNPPPGSTGWAGVFNIGCAARPWFFTLVRLYVEGQANIKHSIHAVVGGLEVVLAPTVEGKGF